VDLDPFNTQATIVRGVSAWTASGLEQAVRQAQAWSVIATNKNTIGVVAEHLYRPTR
jgi:hypothetical protein